MEILESNSVLSQKEYLIEHNIEYGIIYGHKCIETDLWYVGLTTTSIQHRSQSDGSNYLKKKECNYIHTKFAPAIEKYGWENFEHYVLGYYSLDKLSDMEIFWIHEKDSYYNGYNATKGGVNTWPKYLSESAKLKISESNRKREIADSTRKKISESKKGKRYLSDDHYKKLSNTLTDKNKGINNPMYQRHHSTEFKEALSKKNSGMGNPNYGKKMSDPSRKKLSSSLQEYYKTHDGPNAGKKLSDEEIEFLRKINTGRHPSMESRKKMSESQKKRIRKGFSDEGKKNIGESKKGLKSPVRKDVIQLDKNMNYVQTFISASDAGKSLGLYNGSQITACCKGKQKTCGRFHMEVLRGLQS